MDISDYLKYNNDLINVEDVIRYKVNLYGGDATIEVTMIASYLDKKMLDSMVDAFFIKAYDDPLLARRGVQIQTGNGIDLRSQGYGANSTVSIPRLIAQNMLGKRREHLEEMKCSVVPNDDNWLNMTRDNLMVAWEERGRGREETIYRFRALMEWRENNGSH